LAEGLLMVEGLLLVEPTKRRTFTARAGQLAEVPELISTEV
jgi:hypothetical protein